MCSFEGGAIPAQWPCHSSDGLYCEVAMKVEVSGQRWKMEQMLPESSDTLVFSADTLVFLGFMFFFKYAWINLEE